MSEDFAVKYENARDRILAVLRRNHNVGWTSWRMLRRIGGVRYGARLRELKRLGYKFEENHDPSGDGFTYRLLSLTPGAPDRKMVKVYVTEIDAIALIQGRVAPSLRNAVAEALSVFQANKHKL